METLKFRVQEITCADGTKFLGASCLGMDLPVSLREPGKERLRYHVRISGVDTNSLEVGWYAIEAEKPEDIWLDERDAFRYKNIIRAKGKIYKSPSK